MTLNASDRLALRPAVLASLLVSLVLAGCGQSGPLYLPGNPSRVQVEDTVTLPEGSEDEEAAPGNANGNGNATEE